MPRSTTRPPSRTRISSTCSRPARRWVMRSVDRPSVRASRSAVRASAAAASRCSAGSSRMRTGSRPAGPGPRRPVGAVRPTGDDRAVPTGGGEPVGQPGQPRRRVRPGPGRPPARRRWPRAGRCGGSRPASCRRDAGSARPVRRPGARRRPAALQRDAVEQWLRRRRPGGSAPGRRPASTCPRRSGRRRRPAGRARARGRRRAARRARLRGSDAQTSRSAQRVGAAPRSSGRCGVRLTTGGASMASKTRPAADPRALQGLGRRRQRRDELEGGQRAPGPARRAARR